MIPPTLILMSGLPGCGKTSLARQLAQRLHIPILSKDRLQQGLRAQGLAGHNGPEGYLLAFDLADEQLALGVGVILDAVFPLPGYRSQARAIAQKHGARFCPIYCYCSNERLWQARMNNRTQYVPDWTPKGWDEVLRLRDDFVAWSPQEALCLNAIHPVAVNLQIALHYLASAPTRTSS